MRKKPNPFLWAMCVCTLLVTVGALHVISASRTIEFDTRQVTQPDVALTPDGKSLIFTMLGHLFRLPVDGGSAEQLTFGPYYDTDPAISPDGACIAFVSDRDGSEGNIFFLDLGTKRVSPQTKEARAGRPAWSPDGQAIVFLSYEPRNPRSTSGTVRRISLRSGGAETINSQARDFGSLFYLPDGRLAWSIAERDSKTSRWKTRVEAMDEQGRTTALASLDGLALRVTPSPAGDGFYCRRQGNRAFDVRIDEIVFVPLAGGSERSLLPATGGRSRFAVTPDNKTLYFGQGGSLWKVRLPEGARSAIPLQAHVKLEIRTSPQPAPATLTRTSTRPRSIMTPRLTPDGRTLIFGAAGFLWRQSMPDGIAERISSGQVYEDGPSLSPDGSQLAFVRYHEDKVSVSAYDLRTRQIRSIVSGMYSNGEPGWTGDGRKLTLSEYGYTRQVVAVSLADGKKEQFAEFDKWFPFPHVSADGRWLYYTSDKSGIGQLYRLSLQDKNKEEMVTRLSRHLSNGLISPDGRWLAFRRNEEIWVAPFGSIPITDGQARLFSAEGGDSFAFTSDSSALIYSAGNNVWLQPLAGGKRRPILVRLDLPTAAPAPLLLRSVRLLDFESDGFASPTNMFIEEGRISWIGSESGHNIPSDAEVVDCAGRFAIPGLFDFHTYTAGNDPVPFIAYGVTSLRDVEGSIPWMNALRDRGEFTAEAIPRYFFSGGIFEGEHPEWGDGFHLIYDESSAREYVRRYKEGGADSIKLYSVAISLAWPLECALAEEAHRLGLPVVASADSIEEMTKGVTLGCSLLEYGNADQANDDVIQMLSQSGTRWVPVMTLSGAAALLLREEPEKLLDPKLRSVITEQSFGESLYGSTYRKVDDTSLRGYVAALLARIGEAHRQSVKLYAGTGSPEPDCFPGQSLHWELARFVQAGLTPLDVLRMATEEAAAAVGAAELGTLAPGKIADVVLLSADPIQDIHNTEAIWRVIKGGWLFDPDKLAAQAPSAEASK
jgi:Tol biopolymer transport system component/imidazolonepropionase-like amidohydrolase